MKELTIYDIAEKAGVSPTTVSRILNNRGAISEKTKKKVFAVVKELNYIPNQMARSLQKEKKSSMIGVVLPNIANPFFSTLVQVIDNSCHKHGYKMLICTAAQETSSEEEYVRILKSYGVAGVLLRSRFVTPGVFDNIDLSAVSLEVSIPGIPCVTCDNFEGGRLAAKTLIESGSLHPMYLGESGYPGNTAQNREDGFKKGCEEANVPCNVVTFPRECLLDRDFTEEVVSAFEKYPETDGLFVPSDIHAARVTSICYKMGYKVPEDVQIVGFDGTYIAKTFGTTTIVQPLQDMSDYAIELLIKRIGGAVVPVNTVMPVSVDYGVTTKKRQ